MLTYALEKAIFGEYGNAQRQEKNTIRLYEGKTRESVKAEVRPSGSAGDSASLSLSVQPYYFVAACACLAVRVSAPPLVYDKHTPQCQITKF